MIKDFDLSNFIKFSSRVNSENYISNDKKLMVKFSTNEDAHNLSDIEAECHNSQLVYELNIPTPKVIDIVETKDHRIGILSEFIENKKSLSTAVRENQDFAKEAEFYTFILIKVYYLFIL